MRALFERMSVCADTMENMRCEYRLLIRLTQRVVRWLLFQGPITSAQAAERGVYGLRLLRGVLEISNTVPNKSIECGEPESVYVSLVEFALLTLTCARTKVLGFCSDYLLPNLNPFKQGLQGTTRWTTLTNWVQTFLCSRS